MNENNKTFIDGKKCPQIQEVKSAMKSTKSKRMYQRYHVIYLYLKGHANKEISGMVGLCQHTIGAYVNSYKANSLDGLVMGKSTGLLNS